jgi:hypothetical protein
MKNSLEKFARPTMAVCLMLTFAVAAAGAAKPATKPAALSDSAIHGRVYSVKDMPGYVPLVDPESSSVRIGRRVNAPLVSMPFQGGAKSLKDLGQTILRQLGTRQRDSILTLCVTDKEFRDILWPEFPQSRPVTGLHYDDAWKILYARMHAGVVHANRDYGGDKYQFVSITADSVMKYKNFTMYSKIKLNSVGPDGGLVSMTWLRGVVERKGRVKIYSTED